MVLQHRFINNGFSNVIATDGRRYVLGVGIAEQPRDIGAADILAGTHDDGTLDDVAQFTDIAGPVIIGQLLQRALCEQQCFFILFTEEIKVVAGDGRDIFAPLFQGGQADRKNIQPVIKVLAELAHAHHFL